MYHAVRDTLGGGGRTGGGGGGGGQSAAAAAVALELPLRPTCPGLGDMAALYGAIFRTALAALGEGLAGAVRRAVDMALAAR